MKKGLIIGLALALVVGLTAVGTAEVVTTVIGDTSVGHLHVTVDNYRDALLPFSQIGDLGSTHEFEGWGGFQGTGPNGEIMTTTSRGLELIGGLDGELSTTISVQSTSWARLTAYAVQDYGTTSSFFSPYKGEVAFVAETLSDGSANMELIIKPTFDIASIRSIVVNPNSTALQAGGDYYIKAYGATFDRNDSTATWVVDPIDQSITTNAIAFGSIAMYDDGSGGSASLEFSLVHSDGGPLGDPWRGGLEIEGVTSDMVGSGWFVQEGYGETELEWNMVPQIGIDYRYEQIHHFTDLTLGPYVGDAIDGEKN